MAGLRRGTARASPETAPRAGERDACGSVGRHNPSGQPLWKWSHAPVDLHTRVANTRGTMGHKNEYVNQIPSMPKRDDVFRRCLFLARQGGTNTKSQQKMYKNGGSASRSFHLLHTPRKVDERLIVRVEHVVLRGREKVEGGWAWGWRRLSISPSALPAQPSEAEQVRAWQTEMKLN